MLGALDVTLQTAHQLVAAAIALLLLQIEAAADDIGALIAAPAVVHQILTELGVIAADGVEPIVIATGDDKAGREDKERLSQGCGDHGSHLVDNSDWQQLEPNAATFG